MLTAEDVLNRYREEDFPEFIDRPLKDVNEVGLFGNRPLHVAVNRGNADEVRALIVGGADVNALGELDMLPIHEAISEENLAIVRLLLDAGARVDGVNEFGKTPLDMAKESGNPVIIELVERHRTAG